MPQTRAVPSGAAASILGTWLGRELVERLVDPLLGGITQKCVGYFYI